MKERCKSVHRQGGWIRLE